MLRASPCSLLRRRPRAALTPGAPPHISSSSESRSGGPRRLLSSAWVQAAASCLRQSLCQGLSFYDFSMGDLQQQRSGSLGTLPAVCPCQLASTCLLCTPRHHLSESRMRSYLRGQRAGGTTRGRAIQSGRDLLPPVAASFAMQHQRGPHSGHQLYAYHRIVYGVAEAFSGFKYGFHCPQANFCVGNTGHGEFSAAPQHAGRCRSSAAGAIRGRQRSPGCRRCGSSP